MSKIDLSFGTPEHGWLTVTLSSDGTERVLDASDVPADSLKLLATALLNLVAGWHQETSVTWCLEPDEVIWLFRRHGDQYEVLVRGPEPGAKPEPFTAGTMDEICTPMWRALRRLEVDPAWNVTPADSRTWSHPFPSKEVALLGEKLRADKRG